MSDTAGYTDAIFGIFHLLGYQFSPRIADIGGSRFWRVDRKADYGVLNDLASNKINGKLIAEQWDDLLRLAGSLKLGVVQAAGLNTDPPNQRPANPAGEGASGTRPPSSRLSICCATSTTNNTAGASWFSSTVERDAINSPASSSMASEAHSSDTAKGRKTNSAHSASSSTS